MTNINTVLYNKQICRFLRLLRPRAQGTSKLSDTQPDVEDLLGTMLIANPAYTRWFYLHLIIRVALPSCSYRAWETQYNNKEEVDEKGNRNCSENVIEGLF